MSIFDSYFHQMSHGGIPHYDKDGNAVLVVSGYSVPSLPFEMIGDVWNAAQSFNGTYHFEETDPVAAAAHFWEDNKKYMPANHMHFAYTVEKIANILVIDQNTSDFRYYFSEVSFAPNSWHGVGITTSLKNGRFSTHNFANHDRELVNSLRAEFSIAMGAFFWTLHLIKNQAIEVVEGQFFKDYNRARGRHGVISRLRTIDLTKAKIVYTPKPGYVAPGNGTPKAPHWRSGYTRTYKKTGKVVPVRGFSVKGGQPPITQVKI
jgi:hypothetical protein